MGNSAFVLLVATLMPIYFYALADAGGVDSDLQLSYWGYAGSISTLLVAIIGPLCGAISDQKGLKKPIFTVTMLVGVIGCVCLGLAGSWLTFLAVFVVAKVGFNASLVFYDSMLPEVTSKERSDNISSMGYAFGYIGSVIPFLICLVLVLFGSSFGLSTGPAMVISFLLTAAWWLCCTLPLLKHYKQTAGIERRHGNPFAQSFGELWGTVKHAAKHKHIGLYLISFFFFINGVYTIINMATAYGQSLGLDTTGLLLALLVTQIVAFPSSIFYGRLAQRVDAARMMKISILCYAGIVLFAVFLVSQWQFWLLAVLVGLFQGGIQALSRSYLGKIIPAERSGSYYGVMDICGKGADFFGSMLVAAVNQLTADVHITIFGITLGNANIAVSSLLVLFAIGYLLFCKADRAVKAAENA